MSSALEDRAQIAGMLVEEGIDVTIRRITPGAYDPATGSAVAGTTQDFPGRGRLGNYSSRAIDGVRIKVGDRQLTFQPTDWSYEPKIGDILTVPASLAIIGPIQKRELGGTPFSFTAQVRGAP